MLQLPRLLRSQSATFRPPHPLHHLIAELPGVFERLEKKKKKANETSSRLIVETRTAGPLSVLRVQSPFLFASSLRQHRHFEQYVCTQVQSQAVLTNLSLIQAKAGQTTSREFALKKSGESLRQFTCVQWRPLTQLLSGWLLLVLCRIILLFTSYNM